MTTTPWQCYIHSRGIVDLESAVNLGTRLNKAIRLSLPLIES